MYDSDAFEHISQLERDITNYERGAAGMERQLDSVLQENYDLRQQIVELKLEIARLGGTP